LHTDLPAELLPLAGTRGVLDAVEQALPVGGMGETW